MFVFFCPYMSIETLQNLLEKRKWFDFTELVIKMTKDNIDKQILYSMLNLYLEIIQRLHPISVTMTTIAILPHIQHEEALNLIEMSISAINNHDGGIYKEELCSLEMHRCMIKIQLKKYENIESQIIFWLSKKLSDDNYNFLLALAGNFYESIGNIENAHEFFLKHAKASKKVQDIEKLVRLSILSTTFFDLSSIMKFEEYDKMKDSDLKFIFTSFSEENVENANIPAIMNALNITDANFIKEKFFINNIITICFKSESKMVEFETFLSRLPIDEITLLRLLLKALGIGVISGWVDSEKRTLFFDRVIPRSLNTEEINKMKLKFIEWKKRVDEIIQVVKSES